MVTLSVLKGQFAVCRLPPTTSPPPWVWDSAWYALIKTDEELSIVCSQERISEHEPFMNIEKDWSCIKVQGPLDFALTGILASLASPLAQAGISIFAISTYDTDYLLVHTNLLDQALNCLHEAGHVLHEHIPPSPSPRDGPARTAFDADPYMVDFVTKSPTFLLGVAAGWPPDPLQIKAPYQTFCQAVTECWTSTDVSDGEYDFPSVYLYPWSTLHITLATLYRDRKGNGMLLSKREQDSIISAWKHVLKVATEDDTSWPTQSLQLEIESAQIGRCNGILLWRETTGGIAAIRDCLKRAAMKEQSVLEAVGLGLDALEIPNIIHSTFLRFSRPPESLPAEVQERFHNKVLSRLSEFFSRPISIPMVKLFCERSPCLTIPHDDNHVYATSFLVLNDKDRFITDCQQAEARLAFYRSKT